MSHRTIFYEVFFFSATIIATLSVHAQIACTNPSPQPTGYALPCPVFSLSQNSVPQSGTLTLSAAPQASTDYIHTTVFISQNSAWQPYTLQGNGPYPGYSNILSTLNLSSTQLATLSVGIHYAIVWDWLWTQHYNAIRGLGSTNVMPVSGGYKPSA